MSASAMASAILAPGGFAWLLAHDLRLSRRRFGDAFKGMRPVTRWSVAVVALAVFHLLAWPVVTWLVAARAQADTAPFLAAVVAGALFVLPWMLAHALTSATRALYARGDLDLLLASPLPARLVLAARAVAIAIETAASVLIFVAPLVNMCAALGGAAWLALYPVLAASALMAAGIGLALAIGLFQLVGPRRTRLVSQIAATFIGAAFVLGLQAASVLPDETRADLLAAIRAARPGSFLDAAMPWWLPIRAALAEPAALATWIGLSGLTFAAAVLALGRNFATSVVLAAGAPSLGPAANKAQRAGIGRFRTRLGPALRRKEWRLLARDPWLSSQLFLQIIYTLPISVVLWRSQNLGGGEGIALSIAPAVVVIGSQVAASLAWLAVSGEDAPEFLATAPVSPSVLQRHKLEAIAVPVAALMALPILVLAWLAPFVGALTLAAAAAAAVSTALLNLWHPMPGRRRDMMRRHAQSKLVGLMEHLLSLLWVTGMMMVWCASFWAILPLALAMALLWGNWHWTQARAMPASLDAPSWRRWLAVWWPRPAATAG